MADTALKQFRAYFEGTRAQFETQAKAKADADGLIVFILDKTNNGAGSCIYAQGTYFADLETLISTLRFIKGVNVGGTDYQAQQGGSFLKIEAADPATVVSVENGGVKIGVSADFVGKVNKVIEDLANLDHLDSEDLKELQDAIKAADDKAQEALDSMALASEVGAVADLTTTAKTVVGAINEHDAEIGDISDLETEAKTNLVGAINEIKAQVGNTDTNSKVTVEALPGGADYAQIYDIKQGGTSVGKINIPKELVVSDGEVVVNPEGQAAGTYIKLTLQNVEEPLYIDVAKLVDIYTAQANAAQVQLTISAANEISAAIVAGSIGTAELAEGAVTTAKIADKAVTKAKLEDSVQASLDKADAAAPQATTYTKDEVDQLISDVDGSLENYYTKTEVDTMLGWLKL